MKVEVKREKEYVYLLDSGSVEANISSEATDLAGNPLHAFLASDDRAVDVIDALDNIVHGVDI